jgi:hypothetical protein
VLSFVENASTKRLLIVRDTVAHAFDKIDQNLTNLKARAFSRQKRGTSQAFCLKYHKYYDRRKI